MIVIVLAIDRVKIVSPPVPLSSLSSLNSFISDNLLVVMLKVLVTNDVVVLEPLVSVIFNFNLKERIRICLVTYLFHIWLWSLVGSIEIVVLEIKIANDIVAYKGVALRSEVPWLFLRIIRPIFKTLELILKVKHIVSLFIPQCSIFILRKSVDERILFEFPSLDFSSIVVVNLSDRVVTRFSFLNLAMINLVVSAGLALKLSLLGYVVGHIILPVGILLVTWEEDFVGCSLHHFEVCS